ncbi:MAG: hypothetical protein EOO62_23760 [Hymenobacter sp.]|nr:MAG: hypothetical protein EOO62_23760 [Hymenobacter sp.]
MKLFKNLRQPLPAWLLLASLAGPGAAGAELEDPYELAGRLAGSGPASPRNYLLPLVALRQQQAAYTRDTANYELVGRFWEASATYAALADELDSAQVYYRRQTGGGRRAGASPPAAALATLPAAATILAATRHRQLVLFNEEHTQPRGRWLVGSLLPARHPHPLSPHPPHLQPL